MNQLYKNVNSSKRKRLEIQYQSLVLFRTHEVRLRLNIFFYCFRFDHCKPQNITVAKKSPSIETTQFKDIKI